MSVEKLTPEPDEERQYEDAKHNGGQEAEYQNGGMWRY